MDVRVWTGFIFLRIAPRIDSCKHDNEHSISIRCGKFLNQKAIVLNKGSSPLRFLVGLMWSTNWMHEKLIVACFKVAYSVGNEK